MEKHFSNANILKELFDTISNVPVDEYDEFLFRLIHDTSNKLNYLSNPIYYNYLDEYIGSLHNLNKNICLAISDPYKLKYQLNDLDRTLEMIINNVNNLSAVHEYNNNYLTKKSFDIPSAIYEPIKTHQSTISLHKDYQREILKYLRKALDKKNLELSTKNSNSTKEKSLKKDIFIANFNCTFGDHDEPMLSHFDDIVYPSFTSDVKRTVNGSVYFFNNVRIVEYQKNEFVLAGNFIKSTLLEIRSKYDPKNGLTYTNEIHPSAPYSIFMIFLKNHRMLYFRNQKGSPLLTAFAGTAKTLMKKYVIQTNKSQKSIEAKNDSLLPYPTLKVTPVPSEEDILVQLRKVEKIKHLKLKLFPVNGDIEVSDTLNALRGDLFGTDTKTASINISTPKNIEKTAKLIADTMGTVSPTVKAINKQGNLVTLNAQSFTETISLNLNSKNNDIQNTTEIIENLHTHPSISYTSKGNNSIYDKIIGIIKSKLG